MATHPNPVATVSTDDLENEPRLSYDEGFAYIYSLFGSAKEMYAAVGGSDAFMRQERAAWDEHDDTHDKL